MADKINYGASEATLAKRGVDAYTNAAQNNLANVKAEIDKVAAELAAGIQVGMTSDETTALNARLNNLKNQAQTITGQIQASYDFASKQSETSQQEYNQSILAMQEAQRRATAQALGQLQSVPLPTGYSSTIATEGENIQRQALAEQAYMTGRESIPQEMRVNVPGLLSTTPATAGGIVGISGGTQKLFQSALSQAQQSALANLATSQLRLQQEIESEARGAAKLREEKQREKYENFKIAGVNSIINLTSDIGAKTAELQAAAASADTRSGKQIAMAELDAYKKKTAIDLANDLAKIRAQARSAGYSNQQVADFEKATKIIVGADSDLGNFTNSRINTLLNTPRLLQTPIKDPKTGKMRTLAIPSEAGYVTLNGKDKLTWTGKDGFLLDGSGNLFYNTDTNNLKSKVTQINFNVISDIISLGIGSATGLKKAERDKVLQKWFYDVDSGLGLQEYRKAAVVLLGKNADKLDFWKNSFDKTGNSTLGVKSNPLAGNLPPVVQKKPATKATPTSMVKQGLINTFLPFVKQQMFPTIK